MQVKQFTDWEEVTYDTSSKKRDDFDVRLEKISKKSKVKSRLVISGKLIEELCWTEGTTVTLFKSGPMFMLKAKPGGIETLKAKGTGCKQLCIVNQVMVLHMHLPAEVIQSDEPVFFEGWTDLSGDGSLIFTLKE